MNEIQTRDAQLVVANNDIFSGDSFAKIYQIAEVLVNTSMVPESLLGERINKQFVAFPKEKQIANCVMVVEQTGRWGISPFAGAAHASIVRGRLMWEGKLVSAMTEKSSGVRLNYKYKGSGLNRVVQVFGKFRDEDEERTVEGSVKDWKTSQWTESNYDQRLSYRGAREWNRRHSPAAMLGILTDDEELPQQEMRTVTKREKVEPFKEIEEKPVVKESLTTEEEAKPFEVTIGKYELQEGESKGKPWKLHILTLTNDGKEVIAKTFSNTIGGLAEFNVGRRAIVTLEKTAKGLGVLTLEILDGEMK